MRSRDWCGSSIEKFMPRYYTHILVLACFATLFLDCYAPAFFGDRQFGYRDAAHYYYPLYQKVQEEWKAGRWPLWEREENAGMPLLGNPTAAVLYPGKLVFTILPYAWGIRVYVVIHTALAFATMLVLTALMAGELGRLDSGRAELCLRNADLVPVLQYRLPRRSILVAPRVSCGRPLGSSGPPMGPRRVGDGADDADARR